MRRSIFLLVCFLIDLNLSPTDVSSSFNPAVFQARAICKVFNALVTRRLSLWWTHSLRKERRVRKWLAMLGEVVMVGRVKTCLLRKKESRAR